MWTLLWFGLVVLLAAFWLAPEYWQHKVYPRITMEANFSHDIADVGDAVQIRCQITNPSRLPCPRVRLLILLPDELSVTAGGEERQLQLETYLLPRQTAELILTVYTARRGVARWNQAEMECTDMFGLRKDSRTVYPKAQVIVRPKRIPPRQAERLMNELVGDIRTKRYDQEDPSLFTGVRPYQSGDSMRAVSWFATARTGNLMIKQFGHTTESRVLLLLNGQMSDAFWMIAHRERLDILCEQALQLTDKLVEERATVGFLTNLLDSLSGGKYVSPDSGLVQRERIANRLGSLSRHPAYSLAELIRSAGRSVHPGETIVLITDYQDEAGRRALAELRRSHRAVYVYPVMGNGGFTGERKSELSDPVREEAVVL
ncbi:DUF58 domain-containing protein [Gorillibacterium timonense]|uniref:DUF58 domain-containing protein n=1 Tax=Gorillibacterium timonense TaxID=1689269 RepID=UPI00071D0AA9|nr:DUF58 domain-containing protein [Gorillibacterium timonense]